MEADGAGKGTARPDVRTIRKEKKMRAAQTEEEARVNEEASDRRKRERPYVQAPSPPPTPPLHPLIALAQPHSSLKVTLSCHTHAERVGLARSAQEQLEAALASEPGQRRWRCSNSASAHKRRACRPDNACHRPPLINLHVHRHANYSPQARSLNAAGGTARRAQNNTQCRRLGRECWGGSRPVIASGCPSMTLKS